MAVDAPDLFPASFKLGTHEVQAAAIHQSAGRSFCYGKLPNSNFRCPFWSGTGPPPGRSNRLDLELNQALERGEFVLHYQLQLDVVTGRCPSVEALVRWNHPKRGLVLPGDFIPAAEASGLIGPLGAWILHEACRQAKLWQRLGWPLAVAVNISPAQLDHDALIPVVGNALDESGLDPGALELEITEGVLIKNVDQRGGRIFRGLVAQGVRLAIDDFGTGYSSLAYLKHLPVETIKIDRSFVRDMGSAAPGKNLVQWIVMLGQSLGKKVVAEGVENDRQLALLGEIGCDAVQGFHIARPLGAEQLKNLLATEGNCYLNDAVGPYVSFAEATRRIRAEVSSGFRVSAAG